MSSRGWWKETAGRGYVLVAIAIAVAALAGLVPGRVWWVIAAVFLWAGATLVGRARGWRIRWPALPALGRKEAVAAGVVAVALGGGVYFGSLNLGPAHACVNHGNGLLNLFSRCPSRAFWQFPVAAVIASLGVAGAIGVLKRT